MDREDLLKRDVNIYVAVFVITFMTAAGLLLVLRAAYQDSFYVMVGSADGFESTLERP